MTDTAESVCMRFAERAWTNVGVQPLHARAAFRGVIRVYISR